MAAEKQLQVGIIGGGVSGLTAARVLDFKGSGRLSVTIFEATNHTGGLARNFHDYRDKAGGDLAVNEYYDKAASFIKTYIGSAFCRDDAPDILLMDVCGFLYRGSHTPRC